MKDEQLDGSIEQALKTHPQRPLPAGFVQVIMGQVRKTPQVQVSPYFRLQLFDFALPTFVAGVFVLLLQLAQGNLQWRPQTGWSIELFDQFILLSPELLGILLPILAVELLGMGLICWWLWGDRPYLLLKTAD